MISKVSSWSWWKDTGNNNGVVISVAVTSLLVISWSVISRKRNGGKLLPGPRGWPLIGNLLSLEPDLHFYFTKLAKVYGPIYKLQWGMKCLVVLNSSALAKEGLRDQDAKFADRDGPVVGMVLSYGGIDMVWSASDSEWRKLRKISAHELMSNTNLDSCYNLRRKEVRKMVKDLYSKIETPVDVYGSVFTTNLNVIMSMLWGGTLTGDEKTSINTEFRQLFHEIVELSAQPNVSDFFPILECLDIQGIGKKAKALLVWMDRIFASIIDQHMKLERTEGEHKGSKDFLQFLLELMEKQDPKTQITMTQMKALFMDIAVGGTDTTSTTVEWVISEMIQNPDMMKRAQAELEEVVGKNNIVEESHIPKLPYLDAVVRETLRLHPPAVILVRRCPDSPCTIGGYTIPKGAKVIFNVWGMHMDAEAWNNPTEFLPERFLTSTPDDTHKYGYKGNNFNYLPFGSGRRVCVGISLAERMVTYLSATLLHSFDWQVPEGTKLDLTGKFGIVSRKSIPLVAVPTPRFSNPELYV
ncbi:hypothetical protein MKW94_027913 [Papaver nudicaule]|uniref:N-methylcoclaurine 3'-monooxygenase n=1 Tax=Papaver nudicaule TaxID=74823 RepID=A0AA41SNS0_PAPNU|nr:hypothetical protein [Papaver nudicaule]